MVDTKVRYSIKLSCAALLAVLVLTGCVERKLTINTKPQGALVALNDEEIGTSPVTVAFNWYGDYKVRLIKQDYAIVNTHRKLEAPLHDRFPFDFFYEVLWPKRIVDEYEWTFELTAYQPPDRTELLDAAEKMKARTIDELKVYELRKAMAEAEDKK